MSEFVDYYNTIDDIYDHLFKSFIGPLEENETFVGEEPLSRYSMGILWPEETERFPDSDDQLSDELFDEEPGEDNDSLKKINTFYPSAMALTVTVKTNTVIDINVSFAVYKRTDNGDKMYSYTRKPFSIDRSVLVPNKVSSLHISDEELPIIIQVFVRRVYDNGDALLTVSCCNRLHAADSNIEKNKNALFQCRIILGSDSGFLPLYIGKYRTDDEKKNEMLYSSVKNYAYGHGCSTAYISEQGKVKSVYTEFLPKTRLNQMMPKLIDDSSFLYMKYWCHADRISACGELTRFVDGYKRWKNEIAVSAADLKEFLSQSDDALRSISVCIDRLRNGINVLLSNDTAWKAFCLMNEAMLLQRTHSKKCSENTVRWYPFQLAYILQIVADITDKNSLFRNDVDLLWFPTGGGKTEAYLGLAAFAILYRRICRKTECDGVNVIMRYTLRLLTIQQFERASALVCALEDIRERYKLSGGEISIGLWIGSGMTPNHIEQAAETLRTVQNDSTAKIYEANPVQITTCPWCGSSINIGGYSIENGHMKIRCQNHNCRFNNGLPIYVIDDDIYCKRPTILLSTVDKFARLAWEEDAGNLLNDSPELIIQDELHLISGPLGSLSGIYEIAVDEIIKKFGSSPKIIASTATVKNAKQQIKILYNRDMIQFPPNGISYNDSFFAVEASPNERPARTYIGLCSIGTNNSESLIRIFALLMYLKQIYIKKGLPNDVIDQFYTTVGYFNTIKELGTASSVITDRINSEVKYLISRKFRTEAEKYSLQISDIRYYLKNDELTSRKSAKEIKDVLVRLDSRFTLPECYDYITASNMLSVGIDIDRLGVMTMFGQPKSNAEYIQATSRVGRSNPGVVIVLYNSMRSRDKSYYEQFEYYHKTFYKYVEATSITSYAARAIEKALHCAFVSMVRHMISNYNSNESAGYFDESDSRIIDIKQRILNRVSAVEPSMEEYADQWLDYYIGYWKQRVNSLHESLVYYDYHNEDTSLLKAAENVVNEETPVVLNSVRNVEPSVNVYFTKR